MSFRGDRHLFKLAEHLPFVDMTRFYGSWRDRVRDYDTIIIFDAIRGRGVIEYIHQQSPHTRIILYYVNTYDL